LPLSERECKYDNDKEVRSGEHKKCLHRREGINVMISFCSIKEIMGWIKCGGFPIGTYQRVNIRIMIFYFYFFLTNKGIEI